MRNEGEKKEARKKHSREGREEEAFKRFIKVHQDTSLDKSLKLSPQMNEVLQL